MMNSQPSLHVHAYRREAPAESRLYELREWLPMVVGVARECRRKSGPRTDGIQWGSTVYQFSSQDPKTGTSPVLPKWGIAW